MRRRRRWLWAIGGVLGTAALAWVGFVWWALPGKHHVDRDVELPTRYDQDRFYAEPTTTGGAKLSLLTDTGGGMFLTQDAAARCAIKPRHLFGKTIARLPAFRDDGWIPEPTGGESWMPITRGEGDGMLGQRWFAGGIWTFDYPRRRLILRQSSFAPSPEALRHSTPLGFRTEYGVRTASHPRFTVTIDGEPLDALFDTGATVWLTPEALAVVNEGTTSERATSFVRAAVFARWHAAHPEWRVIERGCAHSKEALIEVPRVQVAGLEAGPVWFTRRLDANLDWMSSFTDKPIAVSMGGNFLRRFRVTLDYPCAIAYFESPSQPAS